MCHFAASDTFLSANVITRECAITLDDLAPSQLVEYRFDETGPWMLGNVSFLALEEYRKVKFDYWKNLMLNPTCEAAFKRMLKVGCVTSVSAAPELLLGPNKTPHA